jgi:hypothetical protein
VHLPDALIAKGINAASVNQTAALDAINIRRKNRLGYLFGYPGNSISNPHFNSPDYTSTSRTTYVLSHAQLSLLLRLPFHAQVAAYPHCKPLAVSIIFRAQNLVVFFDVAGFKQA